MTVNTIHFHVYNGKIQQNITKNWKNI